MSLYWCISWIICRHIFPWELYLLLHYFCYNFLRITENVLQKKKLTYLKRSSSQIQNIYRSRVVWTWTPSLFYTKYCTSITFKNFCIVLMQFDVIDTDQNYDRHDARRRHQLSRELVKLLFYLQCFGLRKSLFTKPSSLLCPVNKKQICWEGEQEKTSEAFPINPVPI